MQKTDFIAVVLAAAFFTSCERHVEDLTAVDCSEEVSYSGTIWPIFEDNCMQCHHESHPRGLDFNDFDIVEDNADEIKEATESGEMPLVGTLTPEEIALIGCWVDQGAQEN